MSVLLTGATGFVGTEVLARLLEGDEEIVAIVRGRDEEEAGARLDTVLDGLGVASAERSRARAIPGELTQPGLGLSDATADALAGEVTEIVHCAASISFTLPLREARAINVLGTRSVLELARRIADRGSLRRVVHVSTAYVAGRHRGRFAERDLYVDQEFRNTYEQTKAEAELLVDAAAQDLPIVTLRPSIVMGESDTGWTPAFNVLYWPLRAFDRGLLPAIPSKPQNRVDVVPVDFVADAIVHLLREPSDVRGAVHATAADAALTAEELVVLAAQTLGRDRPPLVEGDESLGRHSDEAAQYMPYFDMEMIFDDERARALLGPAGIVAPPLQDYFAALVAYARLTRWGKAPLTRAQARAQLTTPAA
ncbi:MAG TPA: SDR family oxidoreductase [Solirubrobacteraceae bacterium]|nr:SDR family oxidoreductase [Solirubrobacteraceae bacterium]